MNKKYFLVLFIISTIIATIIIPISVEIDGINSVDRLVTIFGYSTISEVNIGKPYYLIFLLLYHL